jgi:hypothetical protein
VRRETFPTTQAGMLVRHPDPVALLVLWVKEFKADNGRAPSKKDIPAELGKSMWLWGLPAVPPHGQFSWTRVTSCRALVLPVDTRNAICATCARQWHRRPA